MGHWINLDRRARTPLPALRARWEGKHTANGQKRARGRGAWLLRDAGRNGADAMRKGGAA